MQSHDEGIGEKWWVKDGTYQKFRANFEKICFAHFAHPFQMDAFHHVQALVSQNTNLVAVVCVVAVLAFIGYLVMISGGKPTSGSKGEPSSNGCFHTDVFLSPKLHHAL